MRLSVNELLVAQDEANSDVMLEMYLELESDLAFFNTRLRALEAVFATSSQLQKRELFEEVQMVSKLIETVKAYIDTLKSTKTLGFSGNKMGESDLAVLAAQVRGVKALRAIVESPAQATDENTTTTQRDKLSDLIDQAAEMEYSVSVARRWLRRGAMLLGSLVSAAVAVVSITALMTPGVNVAAAAVMVPTMLASAAAFFYLRSPVQTHTPITIGSFHTAVTAIVPSTLGVVAGASVGVSNFKKLRVTNPVREEAARNTQGAVLSGLIAEIKKKIQAMPVERVTLKAFLKHVVERAEKMYSEGLDSWFAETRSSKTLKARLMLRESAKVFERDDFERLTVDDVLQLKVSNSGYTFEQLLNAQRNTSTFWQQKTSTMNMLRERGVILERNSESLSLSLIASVAA